MENAFQYLMEKGCMKEEDYPYVGYDDTCKYDETKVAVKIANCVYQSIAIFYIWIEFVLNITSMFCFYCHLINLFIFDSFVLLM